MHYKVDDAWIAWVRRRMSEMDISQDTLAAQIKSMGAQATGAAISDLLAGKRPESKLVPYINAALGGLQPIQYPLGYEPGIDEVQARIREKLAKLDEPQRKVVMDLVDLLTGKK